MSPPLATVTISVVLMFSLRVLGHDEKPMKPSCSKAKLGYDLDSTLADILHIGSVAELISKALSDAMILHIISEMPITH